MTNKLIFGWTEADLRAVFEACNLDKSVIDEAFVEELTMRVHATMDKLYVLDAFIDVIQDLARERANGLIQA